MENISNQIGSIASRYQNNSIFILGKGSSVDELDPAIFEGNFVIGLNDSEWITNLDVSIFHEDWVSHSISAAGFRSKMYLTSSEFVSTSANVAVHQLPFEPFEGETSDLLMSRLLDHKNLSIEEVMLVTALKVANIVARKRNEKQNLYIVGMDFDANSGYTKKIEERFIPKLSEVKTKSIEMQQHFLQNAIYMLHNSLLSISHVGHHAISTISPSGLNLRLGAKKSVTQMENLPFGKVLITAEITTNHFGQRERLEKLVRDAALSGADLVKFQKRDVETFYSKEQLSSPYKSPFGDSFGDYRNALELNREDFEYIDELCQDLGIGWFLSVLDKPSFHFSKEIKPSLIKLPSTISEHKDFLHFVASEYSGPLVLSTGMTNQDYEEWVLKVFVKQEPLFLLHANSAYPTPEEHCNISVVNRYAKIAEGSPRVIPGYSSHDEGSFGSVLAVAAGARMIEKHVKLGNTEWAHFDSVAVDTTDGTFSNFVNDIRKAERVMGSPEKQITPSEHHKY